MSDTDRPTLTSAAAPTGANPLAELQAAVCWNQIGVYGDGSCPELPRLVHCRNCPVYAAAGTHLLNRPLPTGYRRERTEHFAIEKATGEQAKTSSVIFRLRSEWLGLPTLAFQEVAERRPIHSLPHRRQGHVLGLANVRGELLICVSLGRLLGLEPAAFLDALRAAYHRLLVVNWDGSRLAFPVDEVHGPHRFYLQDMQEPTPLQARFAPAFTRGMLRWEERAVTLLDADLLFETLNQNLT